MNNFEQVEKLWNEVVETLTKLSYLSAGTISLSITFVGGALTNEVFAIVISLSKFLGFPLIYILYLSWTLLLVAIVCGIFVRIPNARNLFNGYHYIEYSKISENYSDNESKKNFKFVADSAKSDADKYAFSRKCFIWITFISFGLGIVTLLLFTANIINNLLYLY